MNNAPDSEFPSRAIVSVPPPKKSSPSATNTCVEVSTNRSIASDKASASKASLQKQTKKYSRSPATISRSVSETFEVISLNLGPVSIEAETFVSFPTFEPVYSPRISVPLFFAPVEQTLQNDSTPETQSTFMTSPPQIQNFYNSYATAKPYVRKSEAPAYYSKPGNRSDVTFGTKQRQQFFGKS
jgi:hypothetical protein